MRKQHLFRLFIGFFVLFVLLAFASHSNARHVNKKGYLGVNIETLTRHEKKELDVSYGVRVEEVAEDGPAKKAGIEEDDVIQLYDGEKIRRAEDLMRDVSRTRPGKEVKIRLVRDKSEKEITVIIGERENRNVLRIGPEDRFVMVFGSPYLGVRMEALNDDLAAYFKVNPDEGALIVSIEPESPADEVGLKAGDVIVKIDDEKVSDPVDVREIISECEAGDTVSVSIIRKGITERFDVALADRTRGSNIHIQRNDWNGLKDLDIRVPDCDHFDMPDFNFDFNFPDDFESNFERNMEDWSEKLEKQLENIERNIERHVDHIHITTSI